MSIGTSSIEISYPQISPIIGPNYLPFKEGEHSGEFVLPVDHHVVLTEFFIQNTEGVIYKVPMDTNVYGVMEGKLLAAFTWYKPGSPEVYNAMLNYEPRVEDGLITLVGNKDYDEPDFYIMSKTKGEGLEPELKKEFLAFINELASSRLIGFNAVARRNILTNDPIEI